MHQYIYIYICIYINIEIILYFIDSCKLPVEHWATFAVSVACHFFIDASMMPIPPPFFSI